MSKDGSCAKKSPEFRSKRTESEAVGIVALDKDKLEGENALCLSVVVEPRRLEVFCV